MITEAMRADYEYFVVSKPGGPGHEVLRRRDFPGSDRIGEYITDAVAFGWMAWQAATAKECERAALVCDRLPCDKDLDLRDACAAAIRSGN